MSKTYYNGNLAISHNALFTFTIGGRSIGKTYFYKKKCIIDFIKKKKQFIYLRRYKEELQKTIKTFFNDVKKEFPNHSFKIISNKFYIDDEVAGYYFPLSTSHILKSMSFPDVETIIFDEFIIDKGTYRYLTQEVNAFLNFYDTISRDRDIKVYFIANAITMTNPYFLYWNIVDIPKNSPFKFYKNNLILLEYVHNEEFAENRRNTRFGQLISNTDYGDFSLDNKFILDSNDFIELKNRSCVFYFAFKYNNKTYGVWRDGKSSILFVSYDYDPSTKFILTTTMSDHSENTVYAKKLKDTKIWTIFCDSYKLCNMRFESMNIKNQIYELIKSIMV